MCGIVGVIGKPVNNRHTKWFKLALAIDSIRGEDSTGMFRINSTDEVAEIFKLDVAGWDFWNYKKANKLIDAVNGCAGFVGHNRFATAGKITAENAHPFNFDDITLVHNGTLYDWRNLNKDTKFDTFDVDSEAMTFSIADVGYAETFKKVNGAYATIWYDAATNTVHALRNNDRPLYFARDKDINGIVYFASEDWMISQLGAREGLNIDEPTLLPEMQLHSFDLSTVETVMTVTPVEGRPVPKVYTQSGNIYGTNVKALPSPKVKPELAKAMSDLGIAKDDIVAVWASDWKAYTSDRKNGQLTGWFVSSRNPGECIDVRIYNTPRWYAKIINAEPDEDGKVGGDYVFVRVNRVGQDALTKSLFIGCFWLDQRTQEVQTAMAKDPTFRKATQKAH